MIRDLLQAPDTECPKCGERQIGWATWSLRGAIGRCVSQLLSRSIRHITPLFLRCRKCRICFEYLEVLPRTAVGYHGCHRTLATRLVAGKIDLQAWRASQNDYDWIGEGIYFWEHAPGRARQWARQRCHDDGAVVAAVIRLGRCLDLADTTFTDLLRESFDGTVKLYQERGWTLPKNEGKEFKLRKLDRLVVDRLTRATDRNNAVPYQTVRCPFEEGEPVYAGGMIRTQSHIQLAVRDKMCIAPRVFLVDPKGD